MWQECTMHPATLDWTPKLQLTDTSKLSNHSLSLRRASLLSPFLRLLTLAATPSHYFSISLCYISLSLSLDANSSQHDSNSAKPTHLSSAKSISTKPKFHHRPPGYARIDYGNIVGGGSSSSAGELENEHVR
ncbi:hypothetical protein Prudu_011177 [Prunus dulcis]|uniref:Uncharacterized protein n=1 Tax=Prunus dulcis TaxID=3755 RepID=A0A4Y1RA08_PRUDU|nr:hypothetical protein Prudu_011177 [Prunus dulcis]